MSDRTNPKDLIGITKVALGLFPGVAKIYGALAFQDGARKYGAYNWRRNDVKMSIYLDAIERHVLALRDGEDDDPKTGIPHLAYIIASAGLLADAKEGGNLIDDRPPQGATAEVLERNMKTKDT